MSSLIRRDDGRHAPRRTRRVTALDVTQPSVAVDADAHMTVVVSGNDYDIFAAGVQAYSALPAQAYTVAFHPQKGFWLTGYPTFGKVEGKIYGAHPEKARKVINRFVNGSGNLGVILTGEKGIGKSVTAKLIANEMIDRGYPVIVVDAYIPGIARFLGSIAQRCCILLDEYDKTFAYNNAEDHDPSTEMLTLFDGVDGGSKLFIVTCNHVEYMNDYLVNRPGRFHFNLQFSYPTATEIRAYLTDEVDPAYADQIEEVVSFANRARLNYDCLHAIAVELNAGEQFAEAIKDLNIAINDYRRFQITVTPVGSTEQFKVVEQLNFATADQPVYVHIYDAHDDYVGFLTFTTGDAQLDEDTGVFTIEPDNAVLVYDGDGYDHLEDTNALVVVEPLTDNRRG